MKQYLLREIGWAYNDSTYDQCPDRLLVDIFDDLELAQQRKKALERAQFIINSKQVLRHETSLDYEERLERSKELALYLVTELEVNPSIVYTGIGNIDFLSFGKMPKPEQLDHIIALFGINLYHIIEVDKVNSTTFILAKSTELFSGPYYIEDHDGNSTFYTSRKEAFSHYFKTWFAYDINRINAHDLIQGNWDDLSRLPALLENLVASSPYISCEKKLFENSASNR